MIANFNLQKENDIFVFCASSHEIYAAYSITFYSYCLQASQAIYSIPHYNLHRHSQKRAGHPS